MDRASVDSHTVNPKRVFPGGYWSRHRLIHANPSPTSSRNSRPTAAFSFLVRPPFSPPARPLVHLSHRLSGGRCPLPETYRLTCFVVRFIQGATAMKTAIAYVRVYLVLIVAFVAFLLAVYIQGGGTWRGPHNLRRSLPAKRGHGRNGAATAPRRGPMLCLHRPERRLRDFPWMIAASSDHGNALSPLKLPTERGESNRHCRAGRRLI
jgi:hypothetical protein